MSEPAGREPAEGQLPGDDGAGVQMRAQASGSSTIIQSGHDTNYYLSDGLRQRRLTDGPAAGECPYPGLAPFTRGQAQWYWGRQRQVAELIDRLDGRRHGGGPLVVVAPSGAGKSSLFQAGLIPALSSGRLPGAGSREWPCLVFTPTAHPITRVAECIASVVGTDPGGIAAELSADPGRGSAILRGALVGRGDGDDTALAIVVVDQLEELFTLCEDEQERRGFIDLLSGLAEAPAGRLPAALVVCGVRADFYAPCTRYPRLRAALQNGQIVLGPMSEPELRETILYPAQLVGLEVEPGLVELLLRDIGASEEGADSGSGAGYEAGRLPLLAHALRRTWQQRHGSTLTVEAYQATGGIQHAVAVTAEEVFTGLATPAQDAARWLFLRLVKLGDGPIEDTRRRATREAILAEIAEPAATEAVLDAFTRARLLTQDQDTVEITHEALLRAWPRLRQWIDSDRDGNLIRQQLEADAATWSKRRDPSALYRGTRLAATRTWADRTPHERAVSPSAASFLAASTHQEHRAARIRRAAIAILATLALLASGTAFFGFREQASANASAATAIAQLNRALSAAAGTEADTLYTTNFGLAAQVGLAAYKLAPTPEAYGSMLNATGQILSGQPFTANSFTNTVAFNSAGSTLETGSADTLQLWHIKSADPTEPKLQLAQYNPHPSKWIFEVWSDPASSTVLASIDQNRVYLFEFGGALRWIQVGKQQSSNPAALAFSHDGRMLAVGHADGTVQLWNIANPADPVAVGGPFADHRRPSSGMTAVAFSPRGSVLATVSGPYVGHDLVSIGTLRLWSIANPAAPKLLPTTLTSQGLLAFSPVGSTMATIQADDSVRLWNIADPGHPKAIGSPLFGHTSNVLAMAFSPDGNVLATASVDYSLRLWNVSHPSRPSALAILGRGSVPAYFSSLAFGSHGLLAGTALTYSTSNKSTSARTWLWETDPKQAATSICDAISANPVITRSQWQQYFPGRPYSPPCPGRQ